MDKDCKNNINTKKENLISQMKSRDLLLERKTNNGMHKQKQIQL